MKEAVASARRLHQHCQLAGQKSLRHFIGIICFTSVHCRNIYTSVVNQKTHTGKIYFEIYRVIEKDGRDLKPL